MYAKEVLNHRADQTAGQSAIHKYTANADALVGRYWSINSKLELIADEVPCGTQDVDAMIARERELYVEKEEIIEVLKSFGANNRTDAEAIAKVLKEESIHFICAN